MVLLAQAEFCSLVIGKFPLRIRPTQITYSINGYHGYNFLPTSHTSSMCYHVYDFFLIFVRKLKKRIKKLRKTLFNILFCFILYCSLPLLHTRSLASSKSLMLVFCPQELEPSSSVDYGTILLIVWKSVAAPSNSSFCPGES